MPYKTKAKHKGIKYPCIICKSAVKVNQDAVLCVTCNQWCHVKCNVPREIHESNRDWVCTKCYFNVLPYSHSDVITDSDHNAYDLGDLSQNPSTQCVHPPLPASSTSMNLNGNGLKLAHLNVRSLRNKIDLVRYLLFQNPFDIFAISESWLDCTISNTDMGIDGYIIERKDRNLMGGGIACYVRSNLTHVRRTDLENEQLEIMWLEIKLNKSKPWLVGVVYRPPSSYSEFFQRLEINLERVLDSSRNVVILGDFNCNMICQNPLSDKLMSICNDLQLKQLIDLPTRITENSSSCIDLILLPVEKTTIQSGVMSVGISDHSLIYVNLKEKVECSKAGPITFRSFKKFDSSKFLSEGSKLTWNSFFDNDDIEYLWDQFKLKFTQLCNAHAPKISVRKKAKCSPWINEEYITLSRERDFLKKKFDETRNKSYWLEYKKSRNALNNLNKKLKKQYFFNQFNTYVGDSKMTWKILNEFSPRTMNSKLELRIDEEIISDPLSVANAFNEHFTTPVINIDSVHPTDTSPMFTKSKFVFSTITEDDVLKELSFLATDKASGLDDIHPRLLKEGAPFISAPLTHMFNVSLKTGRNPRDWKRSRVTPVFKNGDKTDPNNYRPISIISSVMKVLEKLLDNQVRQYLKENNILSKCQSGFRPLHSTNTAVIDLNDYFLRNVDEGLLTGGLFLDLKRAFDTVRYVLLLRKLQRYGFGEHEIAWFTDYFSGREQCVCINNVCSDFRPVTIGVPQGSLLGPLLFSLFIDDLCKIDYASSTKVCLYADDTAVFVKSKNAEDISKTLQVEIDKICDWLHINCLALNIKKTKCMLIGSKGRLKNSRLSLNHKGASIEQVKSFRYLGVIIDSNLKWDEHIAMVRSKIASATGRVQRIKHYLPKRILLLLYYSLFLPHIDYCNVVWGKTTQFNLQKLQKIQNRYARMVLKADFLTPHKEMLQTLQWQSVTQRIQYNTSLMMYKIMNNLAPTYLLSLVEKRVIQVETRYAIACPLLIQTPRTEYFKKSLHYHGSQLWNNLPDCVRTSHSLMQYKKLTKTLSMIDRL